MSSMSLGRTLSNSDDRWFFSCLSCPLDVDHQKLLNQSTTTDSLVAGWGFLHKCITGQCPSDFNRKSWEPGRILKDRLMWTHLQAHGHIFRVEMRLWAVDIFSGCEHTNRHMDKPVVRGHTSGGWKHLQDVHPPSEMWKCWRHKKKGYLCQHYY